MTGTSRLNLTYKTHPDGHLLGEFLMISFLQLHETLLSHNTLNENFSESPQSCFILGEERDREWGLGGAGKVSLETKNEELKCFQ